LDTGEGETSAYEFTTGNFLIRNMGLSDVVITSNALKFYENNSIKKNITFNTGISDQQCYQLLQVVSNVSANTVLALKHLLVRHA